MQLLYWWWALALVLGVLELLTGTFYLLVLALGCAAGGAAAWAGASLSVQLLLSAAVSVCGWLLLHRRHRAGRRVQSRASHDPDVLLDVGERVTVSAWDAHGRENVQYRGAQWTAELEAGGHRQAPPLPGEYRIRGIDGNRLLLAPIE